ncbi:MAG: putative toxin-antitoxin system toxin component, PIN family [Anaerolineales bacterium]|nr:putative toxin-antitoxin system toxin component, PIN family [Anaerolineales bacterium]
MIRAVLDANVIVSSVISKKGAPFQLIQAWTDFRFTLITSKSIIEEVQRVISEPRLKDKYRIANERIFRLVKTLRQNAVLVPGSADLRGAIPDDPSDEMFLTTAINAKAKIIVSGDKHLLNLKTFQGIAIMTPRQFLDQLEQERPS